MKDIEWETPPPREAPRGRRPDVVGPFLKELANRPGAWAVWKRGLRTRTTYHLKKRAHLLGLDVQTRTVPDDHGFTHYVRVVGSAS